MHKTKNPVTTIGHIRFIGLAQELGFSLDEIDDLLSLRSEPGKDYSDVRQRALKKRKEADVKKSLA